MTNLKTLAASALLAFGFGSAAFAADMMTDANGMTLYVFDKDSGGASACYDDCAVKWPPYLAQSGEAAGKGWSQVARKDGAMQWAYDGKPLYYFKGDHAKGDHMGDGLGGVWHMLKH